MATALADGWPVRTDRRGGTAEAEAEAGPVVPADEGPFAGPRWLYVWNRDSLGECCCWRGTLRASADGAAVGAAGSCQRPGKHPWVTRVDGQLFGFTHGAADAMSWWDLADLYGPTGGARQLAVVLDDLLVVDIDGERALRDFARMAHTVPKQKILGVSTSPRGFHVWLDCPGWNQKALNTWMSQWLSGQGGWHGTDAGKVSRRGYVIDVRTGSNRFVVWPGEGGERRWISRRDFGQVIKGALAGMPSWRMVPSSPDSGAPWVVDTADSWMAGWIEGHRGGGEMDLSGLDLGGDGSDPARAEAVLDTAWDEMERWLARLERMAAGSGRNNLLNQIAYYSGSRCVVAGHSVEAVRGRLLEIGEGVGTHGVRATVESGLSAGLQAAKSQLKKAEG